MEKNAKNGIDFGSSTSGFFRQTDDKVTDAVAQAINSGKYPDQAIEDLITKIKNKRSMVRESTNFSPEWQEQIRKDLQTMLSYRETQIVDSNDPDDDGLWNYGVVANILDTRNKSCEAKKPQFPEVGRGYTQANWDEIIEGYCKKELIKKPQ